MTNSQQRTTHGFLQHRSQWSENTALQIAEKEAISLTDRHWDIINFVRTEFYANNGYVPGETEIRSAMEQQWNTPFSFTDLDALFPGGPHIQAAKIAGCITVNTVSDLLAVKGNSVWSIKPDEQVTAALRIFAEKNIGALMVVEGKKLVGVVSERDFTRGVVNQAYVIDDTKVSDIMSAGVITVAPDDTLEQCMALMTDRSFRHLPVLDQGQLVGVLSMPDLVKVIVDQQRFVISQLQDEQTRATL